MRLDIAQCVTLVAAAILSGCGGGSGSGSSDSGPKVLETVTYGGAVASDQGTATLAVELDYLDNDTVDGTFSSGFGGEGTVTGDIDSDTLTATLELTGECSGEFRVRGAVDQSRSSLSGSFSGEDCTAIYGSGVFSLLEVEPVDTNLGFSGLYAGTNIDNVYALRLTTENEEDYTGRAVVFEAYEEGSVQDNVADGFAIIEAPVQGRLNNDISGCRPNSDNFIMRVGADSQIEAESESAFNDISSLNAYIRNPYQTGDGTTRLDSTQWCIDNFLAFPDLISVDDKL